MPIPNNGRVHRSHDKVEPDSWPKIHDSHGGCGAEAGRGYEPGAGSPDTRGISKGQCLQGFLPIVVQIVSS